MASSPTELYLPPTFPYPIKIISLDVQPASSVERGTRLLGYSFVHLAPSPDAQSETRFGTWDSAIEGALEKWNIKVGDVISQRRAKERPVVVVIEPCKHGMQLGGLCVLCGKDMTNTDYTGFSDASRASIQMTHSAFGPTVSLEEAQRIERETAQVLLKARKLSLIVDLDQTIVHATVDPTVGEWINEGEVWEARQASKASSSKAAAADDSDDTSSDSDDECNPNWEALKDVKKFRLGPELFGSPRLQKGKGKNKAIENDGCMYYIKPRPGWEGFLQEMAKMYEMHVYTMGTRAYAEEVCAAIDPDGKIFGGRLLSRDESGSLTQKSLQRLFPCDTSMVVIIDDRADVWEWSPNLVKVVPYDFFVGIGDINSTFLPKLEPIAPVIPSVPPPASTVKTSDPPSADVPILESPDVPIDPADVPTPLVVPEPAPPPDNDTGDLIKTAMVTRNTLALEAQLEERPLAKKQEALSEGEAPHEDHHHHHHHPSSEEKHAEEASPKEERATTPKPERKALLKNDDFELDRVSKILREVHDRFFDSYDTFSARGTSPKRREKPPYDVTKIIPRIRTEVLEGVHLLFSSVIPLDTRPESTEIWKMAHMFGARCSTELKPDITHVVAAKRGTVKVDMARKRGGIKIVWLAWFTDSIATWQRQDETPYLLEEPHAVGPSGSSPMTDSHQISSDPEPDADDWDEEVIPEAKEPGSLELAAINWDDINNEVDAFLNESDDDDEDTRSNASGMKSGFISEDEDAGSDMSVTNTPRISRKRLRSVTPSDAGSVNGSGNGDNSIVRSPLAKRKKLAADRTGYSRLKDSISAEDLAAQSKPVDGGKTGGLSGPGSPFPKIAEMGEEDVDDEDDEDDDEDDFLARELEEEWG
ncbi:hypothetical protein C0991_010051 [Blastosporella zonata]|nr:hypothetical protein C0991_010051 [Blastosporella zonata]